MIDPLVLSQNFEAIKDRIKRAATAANRDPASISLIAVSKTQSFESIRALYELGQRDFGENYVQELLEKADAAREAGLKDIRWHFIGHLQTNKVKALLGVRPTIHTVDSERLASEISKRWQTRLIESGAEEQISVFIEVNIDREPSKSGILMEQADAFLGALSRVQGLNLLGLMCIPEPDKGRTGEAFEGLRECARRTRSLHRGQLSMGMTQDFEVAIEHGATHVRVGTAIFGARPAVN